MANKSKENHEEESNQNYELWINHKITDQQYFQEVTRLNSKTY